MMPYFSLKFIVAGLVELSLFLLGFFRGKNIFSRVVIINFNIDRNIDHKNDLWLIWSLSKEKNTNNNGFVCFGNANFANSRMACTNKSVIKEKFIVIDDTEFASFMIYYNPANIYLFKVNNRSTRKRCEIFSKLTSHTFFYCWLWTSKC